MENTKTGDARKRLDGPLYTLPDYHGADLPEKGRADRHARGLIQNLFVGLNMEVRTRRFAVVRVDLVWALYSNAGDIVNLPVFEEAAARYGLTVAIDRARKVLVCRALLAPPDPHGPPWEWERATGETACQVCRYALSEHPRDPEYKFLRQTCDGRRVKL